jgi:RNA polymerase sigma factor (sigma-70 family)
MATSLRTVEKLSDGTSAEEWAALTAALSRYIRSRTSRVDIIEDVVQETLLRLIHHGRLNQIVSVYALAFRIAANLLVDHHRRERWYAGELEEEPMSLTPTPDRVVAGRQELEILSSALAAMPPLRRDVIIRRRLHGQSCAAIAKDLNLSPKAVEKHITRGLLDLNRAIAKSRGAGSDGL